MTCFLRISKVIFQLVFGFFEVVLPNQEHLFGSCYLLNIDVHWLSKLLFTNSSRFSATHALFFSNSSRFCVTQVLKSPAAEPHTLTLKFQTLPSKREDLYFSNSPLNPLSSKRGDYNASKFGPSLTKRSCEALTYGLGRVYYINNSLLIFCNVSSKLSKTILFEKRMTRNPYTFKISERSKS